MALRPWSKFYWADWRADPRLRMCSLSARGLWVEMCGLAHEAEPYGHVLVAGRVPSPDQLASLVGAPLKAVLAALKELDNAGVFSRTDDGVMYCRRMVRNKEREDEGRDAVTRRWANGSPNRVPNRPPNRSPTGEPITPEARSQKPEETPDGVSSAQPADEANDGRKARRKPLREIPADWRPSESGFERARSYGFGDSETERVLQRFRDHWISKAERRADWDASWRTWIDNERDFRRQRTPVGKPDLAEQQERDRAGILAALAPELPARQ